jgi:hypothetical protein
MSGITRPWFDHGEARKADSQNDGKGHDQCLFHFMT